MRRKEPDAAAIAGNAVKFGHKGHYVGDVLGDVVRDDQIEFVIGKWVRYIAEVVDNVGGRSRIVVEADRPLEFVCAAADIENLGHRD
jgi:hypothetical protein